MRCSDEERHQSKREASFLLSLRILDAASQSFAKASLPVRHWMPTFWANISDRSDGKGSLVTPQRDIQETSGSQSSRYRFSLQRKARSPESILRNPLPNWMYMQIVGHEFSLFSGYRCPFTGSFRVCSKSYIEQMVKKQLVAGFRVLVKFWVRRWWWWEGEEWEDEKEERETIGSSRSTSKSYTDFFSSCLVSAAPSSSRVW